LKFHRRGDNGRVVNASFDGGDTLLFCRNENLQIVMPHESQNATGWAEIG
jgi:hypothetical protein